MNIKQTIIKLGIIILTTMCIINVASAATTQPSAQQADKDAKHADRDAKNAQKTANNAGKAAHNADNDAKNAQKTANNAGKAAHNADKDAHHADNDAKHADNDAHHAQSTANTALNDATQNAKEIAHNSSRINDNANQIVSLRRAAAMTTALSGLHYIAAPHQFQVATSVGTNEGFEAVAVGIAYQPTTHWMMNVQVASGTSDVMSQVAGSVGATYAF